MQPCLRASQKASKAGLRHFPTPQQETSSSLLRHREIGTASLRNAAQEASIAASTLTKKKPQTGVAIVPKSRRAKYVGGLPEKMLAPGSSAFSGLSGR